MKGLKKKKDVRMKNPRQVTTFYATKSLKYYFSLGSLARQIRLRLDDIDPLTQKGFQKSLILNSCKVVN